MWGKDSMNTFNKPPVFCDNCSKFALAMLDGAPLCEKCMKTALGQSKDPKYVNNIQPFCFEPTAVQSRISTSPPTVQVRQPALTAQARTLIDAFDESA